MDGDHVELAVVDVRGQDPQRLPLRVVPLLASVDDPEVVRAEVRGHGLGDGVPVLGAYDEHDPVHALDVEDRAHRPGQDRDSVEGEQHLVDGDLVDGRRDPGPGARRQDDRRGPRGGRSQCAP